MRVPAWALWLEMAMRVVWLVSAAGVGLIMRRLGHDTAAWVLVGLVCGPLAVPIAVTAARRAARRPPRLLFAGRPGQGEDDVLVLIDPERPTVAAYPIGPAGAIGRLVLAVVIGRTTSDAGARQAEERRAAAALTAARAAVRATTGIDPAGVVLEGRAARAGRAYAHRFGLHRVVGPEAPADAAPVPAVSIGEARGGPADDRDAGRRVSRSPVAASTLPSPTASRHRIPRRGEPGPRSPASPR